MPKKYCQECGTPNDKTAKFCQNCRAPFGVSRRQQIETQQKQEEFFEESEAEENDFQLDVEIELNRPEKTKMGEIIGSGGTPAPPRAKRKGRPKTRIKKFIEQIKPLRND